MIIASQIELLRGNNKLLDNASATIFPGHKVGLVGKNGCGKSSFFALLKGELAVDNGSLSLPSSWQLAWVAQETPALDKPALEYVMDGDREYRALEAELAAAETGGDGIKVAELHGKLEAIGAYTIRARAGSLLHGLGFTSEQHDNPVRAFSGGWRMRLNLAQALICRSDLLLLDEPTNHLDLAGKEELAEAIAAFPGGVLLVSHDRELIERSCNRFWLIQDGRIQEAHSAERAYAELLGDAPLPQAGSPARSGDPQTAAATGDDEEALLARWYELDALLAADLARKPRHQTPRLQQQWRDELARLAERLGFA